jgi:anti-anti-sigma factor
MSPPERLLITVGRLREMRLGIGSHPDPLLIEVHTTKDSITVVIKGDLDLSSMPLLAAVLSRILEDNPERLIFDLAGVGFVDCAAARCLAGTRRFLPSGRRPVLRFPRPLVLRLLTLTGLDADCEIERPDHGHSARQCGSP